MFIIDRTKNEATTLVKKSFHDLKIRERQHLQEWIDKNPSLLGEPLLIIQKEFSGFADTYERLDLLAIDSHGDLVIIENKLDDSGKDVVWQSLKYASYCAGLSKNDIKDIYSDYLRGKNSTIDAEASILNFLEASDFEEIKLNSGDQRIILVAAMFRKEVTSTVMWLLAHNVNITCIKVTPYELGDQIFLDTDQVLPPPDTEELRIKLNTKKQDEYKTDEENIERYNVRIKFWRQALPQLQKATNLYQNTSPTKNNWISGATGYSGISLGCVVTKKVARVELYIGKSDAEENQRIFDLLLTKKESIDQQYGSSLNWDPLEGKMSCRISHELIGVNIYNEDDWPKMIRYFVENITRLQKAIADPLKEALNQTK